MPVLADTSVWIDQLRGRTTAQVQLLAQRVAAGDVVQADLVVMEVLQGLPPGQRLFQQARLHLLQFPTFALGGIPMVIRSAYNYRTLRQRGLTIRSAIDCMIATFCINSGFELLHNDRDFDPFEQHLGLRVAR